MKDEEKIIKNRCRSILKSDNFEREFLELEKISEKAKDYIKKENECRRIQDGNHRKICSC